jgi:altronate hydrolase
VLKIFQPILDIASGNKTKSELHGYGRKEFVPWNTGVLRKRAPVTAAPQE